MASRWLRSSQFNARARGTILGFGHSYYAGVSGVQADNVSVKMMDI